MTRFPLMLLALFGLLALAPVSRASAQEAARKPLQPMDVFKLEYADDPQISPDGKRIVYVRNFMDVMKDRQRSNLWIINIDGSGHEALTTGTQRDTSPRWSPDGKRLVYLSDAAGTAQLYCRWVESGRTAQLTHLTPSPLAPSWSPDGKQIAFVAQVAEPAKPFVELPAKPAGAEWAAPLKMTRKLVYRFDGKGYLPDGHLQLFVIGAEGGAPRQLTEGPYDHGEPAWLTDGSALVFAANRRTDGEYDPLDSEIYTVSLTDRKIRPLTDRRGPDMSPAVSPDGRHIAYLGFDDRQQGYQLTQLYVMEMSGKGAHVLTDKLQRSVRSPRWSKDSKGVYFLYDDQGNTKIGYASLAKEQKTIAADVGGTTLSRPYASGAYSVSEDGTVAFTLTRPSHPADVAVLVPGSSEPRRLTALNDGLLADRVLGEVEEMWYPSSHDGRKIHGWLVKPPGFDAKKKYPLILEIHGGPFANYGARFAADMQLYAAAGYVVLYANPRGSTSYGEEFGNLIHHAYPGHDYDDLMSGVDAVLARGFVDRDNLFVTGGSGGGVLSAWIIGKTNRFRAAVVAYPVINWHSWLFTSDISASAVRNWFPGPPWEHAEHYRKRSPLDLVGNVTTPAMILTGEDDHRTPISESEQYYKALKLRKVDAALVRVPGASHNVAARPSHLIAKVLYTLKWFETHRQ
jgi:dipeptidyl aminopeptidase/acylaminoacyl peptidase